MAEEMKTLTIGSDTFTVVDGEAVHCCAQDLTEEQKAQARANIGAAAEGSGGGAAAYDPIVFTMDAGTGELSCNKTYDECVEQLLNNQFDVSFTSDDGEYLTAGKVSYIEMAKDGSGISYMCTFAGMSIAVVFTQEGITMSVLE